MRCGRKEEVLKAAQNEDQRPISTLISARSSGAASFSLPSQGTSLINGTQRIKQAFQNPQDLSRRMTCAVRIRRLIESRDVKSAETSEKTELDDLSTIQECSLS